MKTTLFALALVLTVALSANALTVPSNVKAKTENMAVSKSNLVKKSTKSKKAHHKKHHAPTAKKAK